GRGGSVTLVVDPNTTTLLSYHRGPHRRAGNGMPGMGSHRAGADGEDITLPVPDGTVVSTIDGEEIVDLVGPGTRYVAAAGGRGGRVTLVVDPNTTTLLSYHRGPHRRAGNGMPGMGSHRAGADGEDITLPVPDGTVVSTIDGEEIVDLVGPGTRYVAAAGGR